MHDYYYGAEADQFSFYRIPKELFTNDEYKRLSTDAKVLYGLLLNRMDLSARNGWFDDMGRVYIIYTTEEIMEFLNCADNKATKLMNELDEKLMISKTDLSFLRFIGIAGLFLIYYCHQIYRLSQLRT